MGKIEKLLQRMRNNPRDWRIADLETLAQHYGVDVRQGRGSHVYFTFPTGGQSPSVPAHRPIKPVYVVEFLALLEEEL